MSTWSALITLGKLLARYNGVLTHEEGAITPNNLTNGQYDTGLSYTGFATLLKLLINPNLNDLTNGGITLSSIGQQLLIAYLKQYSLGNFDATAAIQHLSLLAAFLESASSDDNGGSGGILYSSALTNFITNAYSLGGLDAVATILSVVLNASFESPNTSNVVQDLTNAAGKVSLGDGFTAEADITGVDFKDKTDIQDVGGTTAKNYTGLETFLNTIKERIPNLSPSKVNLVCTFEKLLKRRNTIWGRIANIPYQIKHFKAIYCYDGKHLFTI